MVMTPLGLSNSLQRPHLIKRKATDWTVLLDKAAKKLGVSSSNMPRHSTLGHLWQEFSFSKVIEVFLISFF